MASNETNSILNCPSLVAMERFAKIRASAKDLVRTGMLRVFRSIIISDRELKGHGIMTESSSQRHAHCSCTFALEFSQSGIPGFAFYTYLGRLVAFAAADGIRFPVANLKALKNYFGTLPDRNSRGNMRFLMMGFPVPFIRSLLRFVSQVITGINRSGISFKLPRKGAGTSLENSGDFPQRFAFALKDCKMISFICA